MPSLHRLHGNRSTSTLRNTTCGECRWEALLGRIARWLVAEGKLFIHIFAHTRFAYPYEVRGPGDWMAQHFFTGGMMPSDDLLTLVRVDSAQAGRRVREHWQVNGTYYAKTSEAWLTNMDGNRVELMPLFTLTYGDREALRWWHRWRTFFMACAELCGLPRR
jgi:cyclopropane-fatty-acyl-phospholipid synthase